MRVLDRYLCRSCGPDQKEFVTNGVNYLDVVIDEDGTWVGDGDVYDSDIIGNRYQCNGCGGDVEWVDANTLDDMKESIDASE